MIIIDAHYSYSSDGKQLNYFWNITSENDNNIIYLRNLFTIQNNSTIYLSSNFFKSNSIYKIFLKVVNYLGIESDIVFVTTKKLSYDAPIIKIMGNSNLNYYIGNPLFLTGYLIFFIFNIKLNINILI
jgi:hypothetical protein